MNALLTLASAIDALNRWIGRGVAWLTLVMVLVQFAVVVLRYVFGAGYIWMQESIIYMHALVFLLGAGYTLLVDGHVRVDIFYRTAASRTRAWLDLAGSLVFLIPVALMILLFSWPYVERSWSVFEGSKETSGLQAVFLLKTMILVFAVLIGLQGLSLAIRSAARLMPGRVPPRPMA